MVIYPDLNFCSQTFQEILELCEMIYMYGIEDDEDGTAGMLFGDLFHLYTKISDKGYFSRVIL